MQYKHGDSSFKRSVVSIAYSVCVCVCSDQESAQHEEADEVHDGKVAAAAELLPRLVV